MIKKLIAVLTKQIDKVSHFCLSMDICLVVAMFFHPIIAVIVTAIAGLLKEWIDLKSYGKWDNWDLLADALGILLAVVMIILRSWIYGF